MKVILCEDVANLGEMGATVKVAAGYARNFLMPRKLAVPAESGSARAIEHQKRVFKVREEKRRKELMDYAKQLEALTLEFKVLAGEEDKMFGSVTTANIAEKFKEFGHTIDRKHILLDEPIKVLGIYTVPVKLATGIEASVKVWVSAQEPEPVAEEEQKEEASA